MIRHCSISSLLFWPNHWEKLFSSCQDEFWRTKNDSQLFFRSLHAYFSRFLAKSHKFLMIVYLQWNDTQLLRWFIELHPSKKKRNKCSFVTIIYIDCKTVVFSSLFVRREAPLSIILVHSPVRRLFPVFPFFFAVSTLAPDLSFEYRPRRSRPQKIRLFCSLSFLTFVFRSRAPESLLIPANGWWGHPAFINLDLTFLNKVLTRPMWHWTVNTQLTVPSCLFKLCNYISVL